MCEMDVWERGEWEELEKNRKDRKIGNSDFIDSVGDNLSPTHFLPPLGVALTYSSTCVHPHCLLGFVLHLRLRSNISQPLHPKQCALVVAQTTELQIDYP